MTSFVDVPKIRVKRAWKVACLADAQPPNVAAAAGDYELLRSFTQSVSSAILRMLFAL